MAESVNRYLNIYIQSGEAQKAYDALIAKQQKLQTEIAKNPKNVEDLRKKLAQLQEPIERASRKLSGELSPSIRDTQTAANNLGNRLKRLSQEDADYSKVIAQYKQASKELDEQRGKVGLLGRVVRSFWQEAKTVATGVIIGNTVQNALETVMGYITGIVTGSAKIADELADIEKTTNLTGEEVKKVNSALREIDTRTSSSELRRLAMEAGKLGNESVADVVKFVDAADKINVALGDALGEGAIIDMAKTSRIFQVEMLNMASAVNEIGNRSEASEAFTVDFIKRMAGVAPTVKLSADQVMGYSAALELAGQTTEVSSTALNTFLLDFVSGAEKFGKAAGFAKGELSNLINTKGTNEGFLQFLTKLRQANPDAAGFINALKKLGIDGARGSNVMLALSNNIQTVREQQQIANDAIQSNSSIMDEFNKKNNNAAAELDKFGKNLAGLFSSQTFMDAGAAIVRTMNSFINALKATPQFIKDNQVAIYLLLAGIALLNKALILSALNTVRDNIVKQISIVTARASALATTISTAAMIAHANIVAVLTGRITLAVGAQRLWNAVLSIGAGPVGILLISLGALLLMYNNLRRTVTQVNVTQKLNNEIESKVNQTTNSTIGAIKAKLAIAKNELISLETRKKALEEVKKASDGYLNNLTLENIATEEGTRLIDRYIKSIRAQAQAKAIVDVLSEKEALKVQKEAQLLGVMSNMSSGQIRSQKAYEKMKKEGTLSPALAKGVEGTQYNVLTKEIKAIDYEIQLLEQRITRMPEVAKVIAGNTEPLIKATTETEGLSKEAKKAAKDLEALQKELEKLRRTLALDRLTDQVHKELVQLQFEYDDLRERAKGNYQLLLIIDEMYWERRNFIIDKGIAEEQKKREEAAKKISKIVKEDANKEGNPGLALDAMRSGLEGAERLVSRGNRNQLAKLELNMLKAEGIAKFEEEKKYLTLKMNQELANTELTENEKKVIQERYRQELVELEKKSIQARVEQIGGFVNQALDLWAQANNAQADRENAELDRDRKINDKKKQNLANRLKSGLISQQQHDREVQRIDKEQEKREKAVKMRQFKRNQRLSIIQATINGFMAVTNAMATVQPFWAAVAASVFAAASTAAQISNISKQKPPEYAKGGRLGGQYHSMGGNHIVDSRTGKIMGNIEKDEGILSRPAMYSTRVHSVKGTPSQIASYLNGSYGGNSWTTGAIPISSNPKWMNAQPSPMNFKAIKRYYALGGVYGGNNMSGSGDEQKSGNNTTEQLAAVLVSLQGTMDSVNQTMVAIQENGVTAYTVLSQQEKQQKRLDDIKKDATMVG